jgi:hypothetical protein
MRRVLLIVLILAFGIESADARRRGHRYRHHAPVYMVPHDAPAVMMPGMRDSGPQRMRSGPAAPPRDGPTRYAYGSPAELIPPDWQLQAPDPNWTGRRFTSPDAAAWFAIYTTPVGDRSLAAHMQALAFVDGEEITYLRGERTWIAVSGHKGERIFYRKAVLACAGKRWNHVAFEYPTAAKRTMDEFVNRAAEAVHDSQNDGCDAAVTSAR